MKRLLIAALALLAAAACTTTDQNPNLDPEGAAQINVQLGARYLQAGDLRLAKEKLEKAEKQDPKNPEVYWVKASLSERMNEPEDADRNYQKAIKLAPKRSEIINTYAVFLCGRGQVERAVQMFDKVVADQLYPTPYAAAANAGVCLRDNKRGADAQRYFERALALRANFVDAVVGLADLHITQGTPDAASKLVQNFLLGGGKDADVLMVGVRATAAQRDCAAAQNYARLLRRDFPNSAQAAAVPQMLGNCSGTTN